MFPWKYFYNTENVELSNTHFQSKKINKNCKRSFEGAPFNGFQDTIFMKKIIRISQRSCCKNIIVFI
jgi:hypothetical protein